MNPAIIELMRYITRKGDEQRQADTAIRISQAEIEARKNAAIAEEQARADIALRQGNIQAVGAQKAQINALKQSALADYPWSDADAQKIAENQYAQHIASGTLADTGLNREKLASSRVTQKKAEGYLPFASTVGSNAAAAEGEGYNAQSADALKRKNVSMSTMDTAPQAAAAQDQANTATSQLQSTTANAAAPLINQLIPAQQQADIEQARQKGAESAFHTTMTLGADPNLAAQAQNAGYGAQAATGNLVQRTGGLIKPGEYGPTTPAPASILQLLSTMANGLTNQPAMQQPQPAPPQAPPSTQTNALPNRLKGVLRQPPFSTTATR